MRDSRLLYQTAAAHQQLLVSQLPPARCNAFSFTDDCRRCRRLSLSAQLCELRATDYHHPICSGAVLSAGIVTIFFARNRETTVSLLAKSSSVFSINRSARATSPEYIDLRLFPAPRRYKASQKSSKRDRKGHHQFLFPWCQPMRTNEAVVRQR